VCGESEVEGGQQSDGVPGRSRSWKFEVGTRGIPYLEGKRASS